MCGVAFIYGSYERVIEPAVPDGNKQADQQQRCAKSQGGKIPLGKGALGVPGALAIFAKATQLHGVADGINAVQAGQNQRQQNTDRILEPCKEWFAFAQLHAAGLLGLADAVVVALDIGDVAQGNGHRISDLIRDADAVQAGSKLAGVGGRDEEDGHRQGHKIFQADVDHIEQLFRCQVIPPEQVAEHRAGAVQGGTLIGIEQEDEQGLLNFFQHAKDYRDSFALPKIKSPTDCYELFVDLLDETGGIATIARILADHEISIKNIGIINNREFEEGVLHIVLKDEESLLSAEKVLQKHSYVIHKR